VFWADVKGGLLNVGAYLAEDLSCEDEDTLHHLNWVRGLRAGDEVFWDDPDGSCSRVLKIRRIEVCGEAVYIEGEGFGVELECFANELREVNNA
jgi:hypothetical protein